MTPRDFLKRNCGDHPWWDSITDEQLDAVMEKYKFNKEDLDDLTNARVIVCELAHGGSAVQGVRMLLCWGEVRR
jgi:hypothetical protein